MAPSSKNKELFDSSLMNIQRPSVWHRTTQRQMTHETEGTEKVIMTVYTNTRAPLFGEKKRTITHAVNPCRMAQRGVARCYKPNLPR